MAKQAGEEERGWIKKLGERLKPCPRPKVLAKSLVTDKIYCW